MAHLSTSYEMVTHFQQLAEHEKAALARELHDHVGGLLIGAAMDLDLIIARADLAPDARGRVTRARESLRSAVEITRRITEELHPTLLDTFGLFAALRWQLKNICASPVKCVEDLPGFELSLTPQASIALYRICQEALIVGLARTGVTEVRLSGHADASTLSLRVSSDGAPPALQSGDLADLNLESMRHRVRALGGVMTVTSPDRGGIDLEVSTPITECVLEG